MSKKKSKPKSKKVIKDKKKKEVPMEKRIPNQHLNASRLGGGGS